MSTTGLSSSAATVTRPRSCFGLLRGSFFGSAKRRTRYGPVMRGQLLRASATGCKARYCLPDGDKDRHLFSPALSQEPWLPTKRPFLFLEVVMHLHEMSERKCDGHGCGHYGASRGSRKHYGLDLSCKPRTLVYSPVAGTVTKLGYTYSDDLSFRYVEISDQGYKFRVFYVEPLVEQGQKVSKHSIIGEAQDLRDRYSGITPHLHLEIKNADGDYIDPTPVMLAQRA